MTQAPATQAHPPDGAEPILSVSDLQAHFRTNHFGVKRDVKAVDGISFEVRRGEIYGLAGKSSSGKTTLIKTIAGAIKPPLEVVGGSVDFAFLPGYGGLHRAPAGRGGADPLAASVLHHAGLDERAEPGAPAPIDFRRLRACAYRREPEGNSSRRWSPTWRGSSSTLRCWRPTRMNCPAACVNAPPLRSPPSAAPISSSPTNRLPRSTSWCRRTCSA